MCFCQSDLNYYYGHKTGLQNINKQNLSYKHSTKRKYLYLQFCYVAQSKIISFVREPTLSTTYTYLSYTYASDAPKKIDGRSDKRF